MKKHLLFLLTLVFLTVSGYSQDKEVMYNDEKALGDKVFAFNLGLDVPLFFQTLGGSVESTNLSTGGLLGVSMEGYLNNEFRLGGGFILNFSANPNGKFLFALPLFAQASYELKLHPVRLVGSMDLGAVLLTYENQVKLDPFLAPGLTVSYVIDPKWSAGLNARYWWIPQLYPGNAPLADQQRLANFMEISLGLSYNWY